MTQSYQNSNVFVVIQGRVLKLQHTMVCFTFLNLGHVTLFPQRWCCITEYLRQAVRRWEHYFSLWQQ